MKITIVALTSFLMLAGCLHRDHDCELEANPNGQLIKCHCKGETIELPKIQFGGVKIFSTIEELCEELINKK